VQQISRQLLLAFQTEVTPSPSNRITVDAAYKDNLGNLKPVISYAIPEYTMRGIEYGRRLSRRIFQRLGAEDHTFYDLQDYGYVSYGGNGYVIRGGNHLAGTHMMGSDPRTSVVDARQRSWDHENLYLVGGGSMPTIGTSNITLTLAALCVKSAGHILDQLRDETAPSQASAA
jgi:choline dehydrogenase-like flavoprotein